MKLRTETRNVEVTASESRQAIITANAKAFKALMDNIYSDKAKSITQEIWSNAFDAHIAAGNADKPFVVTLPSRWDCQFCCRDYGTGLTHDEVMNLYLNLFASTKENSNEGVGMWGLGSKVPFSYTDTFTVTSWQKGRVRYYTMLKDPSGVPTVNFMGEDSTTEPDGLEVKFPVRDYDVPKFVEAAKRVSLGFEVKPEVKDDPDYQWPKIEITENKDGWYRYESPRISGLYAKMGCVLYRINTERVKTEEFMKQLDIVLEFGIGELDVTVSREDLSYDSQTISNLEKKLKEMSDVFFEDIIQQIRSETDPWFRAKKYKNLVKGLHWHVVESLVKRLVTKDYDPRSVKLPKIENISVCNKPASYFIEDRFRRVKKNPRFEGNFDGGKVGYFDGLIFVENTAKGKKDYRANLRIKNYMSTMYPSAMYLQDRPGTVLWVRMDGDDKNHCAEFIQLTETIREKVILCADLPDPGAQKRQSKPVKVQIYGTRGWEQSEIPSDLSKTSGWYVKTERGNVRSYANDHIVRPTGTYRLLRKAGVTDEYVAVPKTYWKRFDNADGWIHIAEAIEGWKEAHKDSLAKFCMKNVLTGSRLAGVVGGLNSPWLNQFKKGDVTWNSLNILEARELAELLKIPYETRNIEEDILERYPMLRYVGDTGSDKSHIQYYIDLIDNQRGN